METNGVRLPFVPLRSLEVENAIQNQTIQPQKSQFHKIFEETLYSFKISKHCKGRIISREIEFNAGDIEKLERAINKAETKGSKESLVLLKDKMFLVSVKNRTIISVFDPQNLEKNVFTNIDSVVFAE